MSDGLGIEEMTNRLDWWLGYIGFRSEEDVVLEPNLASDMMLLLGQRQYRQVRELTEAFALEAIDAQG